MDIKDSVGEGASNAVHDVAMVQLMLHVVKNAKGAPYLTQDYSGTYDAATKNAILSFQTDHKLIEATPAPAAGAGQAKAAKFDKKSFIGANSDTFKALAAEVPAKYADASIIPGTKTVYLAMDEAAAKGNATNIQSKTDLEAQFRSRVANMVTQVYKEYKIALSIPADGWRRNFGQQAALSPAVTGAGPGESNHQYGQAVDIGFNGLRWVEGNGDIKNADYWLNGMPAAKAAQFWAARDVVRDKNVLFKTNKAGDVIHLQAYADAGVSYGRSLAALLQTVSPNHMKWQSAFVAQHNTYNSDLGLGGAMLNAGTARQIWAGQATVSKADLAKLFNAKIANDKNFQIAKFLNLPAAKVAAPVGGAAGQPGAKIVPAPAQIKEADIKQEYIVKVQQRLRDEFKAADTHWADWKPQQ